MKCDELPLLLHGDLVVDDHLGYVIWVQKYRDPMNSDKEYSGEKKTLMKQIRILFEPELDIVTA